MSTGAWFARRARLWCFYPAAMAVGSFARFAADRPAAAPRRRRFEGLTLAGRGRDPRFHLQVVLATLFALSVGAFAHVVEDYVNREELTRWDVEFSRWLHVHATSPLTSFFNVV